jgi:hypothetical protein
MIKLSKIAFSVLTFLSATLGAEAIIPSEHDIAVEIKIRCPMSDEFAKFAQSIPDPQREHVTFEEWKSSFINSMSELIRLVESGKVNNSWWSAKTTAPATQRQGE